MAFLRAVDGSRWLRARKLAAQLPRLKEFATMTSRGGEVEDRLATLRQEVMLMARRLFVEDLRREQDAAAADSEHHRHRRGGGLMMKLSRLRPGSSTTLSAVQGPNGDVCHQPEDQVQALRQH